MLPLRQWHHLKLSITASGYGLAVNGKAVASMSSTELQNWANNTPVLLELGNFDGWVDEIVVRSSTTLVQPSAVTVNLSTPANGATFTAPATVAFRALAKDPSDPITKVEFFQGSTKIGEGVRQSTSPQSIQSLSAPAEDDSSAYAFTWENVPAGTYSLTARVTDSVGLMISSQPAAITVRPAVPTVNVRSLRFENGDFLLRVGGSIGEKFVITTSTDLIQWRGLSTNVLSSPLMDFSFSHATGADRLFYRVVPASE